ncbi:MAG TPA: hypothetical protein VEP90_02820 [Methylomirabilota bacterium]|nr:hypothetical protein [Methylomirabilota bacterium]
MSTLFHNNTSDEHIKTNRSEDRIISFQLIDDNASPHKTGLAGQALAKGSNKMHAQRGPDFLWYVRLEAGTVPPALQQRWTHFKRMVDDIEGYFKARNMSIKTIEE